MVEPCGIFSLPLKHLRSALAACTSFQTWVGAKNSAEAEESIYYVAVDGETDPPFALVDTMNRFSLEHAAGGLSNEFSQKGDLLLVLQSAVDPDHSVSEAALTFSNLIGSVLLELTGLAGRPGYLNITGISLEIPMVRPSEDEKKTVGDFYQVGFRVSYE